MGQDRGFWFPQQRLSSLSPGLNSTFSLSQSGHQDTNLVSENFTANRVTVCGSSPVYAQMPVTHVGEGDKSHGLIYGLSNLRSPLELPQKPSLKQISSDVLFKNQIGTVTPKAGNGCAPKQFLVFDQSGDQTTLVFSSGVGKPFEALTTGSLKLIYNHDMSRGLLRSNNEGFFVDQGIVGREEFAENSGPDVQSEMHEDTEELNALLYSEDESDYSEDEVTSSGHSPSTISAHGNEKRSVGSTNDISEFVGHSHTKKRKLLDCCDYGTLTTPLHTLNSLKKNKLCLEGENDDVESSCASCGNADYVDRCLPQNNKNIVKDKINETLSLLRTIVPGGDSEDPIFVIDRAIDYLKSLKMEAKTLGL